MTALATTFDDFGGDAALAGAGRHVPTSRPLQRQAQVQSAVSTALHSPEIALESDEMSQRNDANNCRVEIPSNVLEFKEQAATVFRRALRDKHKPAAHLAQMSGRDERTAEKWLTGDHVPHAHHLFAMARQNPTIRRWIAHLIGLEADVVDHHEWQQQMAMFARYTAELAAKNGGRE